MKKLASSQDEQKIKPLYQVLRSQGLPVTVIYEKKQFQLWLIQPDYEAHARAILAQYKENPEQFQLPANQNPILDALKITWQQVTQQAGWVTLLGGALVLLVAFIQWFNPNLILENLLIAHPKLPQLELTEPWRLITPVFLHFSATHLIFNLFWWVYLGGRIEKHLGFTCLLQLFFITGVFSNLAQYIWQGPLFGGLSGVVYGLFGFSMVMSANRGGALWLPPALIFFMLVWLLLGYLPGFPVNMANEAHFAGLLAGVFYGLFYRVVLKKPY